MVSIQLICSLFQVASSLLFIYIASKGFSDIYRNIKRRENDYEKIRDEHYTIKIAVRLTDDRVSRLERAVMKMLKGQKCSCLYNEYTEQQEENK